MDVSVQNEGNIFLFQLHTDAAKAWADEHVAEGATYWNGSLVVEHRFAADIAAGMLMDGLEVS